MKSKLAIVVMVVIALLLGVALMKQKREAEAQKQADAKEKAQLNGDLISTKTKLEEQKTVNATLETNLTTVTKEAGTLSNQLAQTAAELTRTSAELTKTSSDLQKTEAEAKAAAEKARQEMAARDAKIGELESRKDDLTKQMEKLSGTLTQLEGTIKDTERKLATSEGDRAFLLKELKRMQAEKAELERQMNDLAFLREQVRALKEELSISRRLEWIRQGIWGTGDIKKGGQILNEGIKSPSVKTNYNLDVEITRDGGVKVTKPATNAAPAAPKPVPAPK
ncbi:MAG TPA: hypothetical protein VK968_20170 [Roseimicrobium sp.]|nr:hypothetical protein [Roseimicrobium sp.]